jgi:hypothetical protein
MCTPAISGNTPAFNAHPEEEGDVTEKIDDWQFNQQQELEKRNFKQSMTGSQGSGKPTNTSTVKQAANIAIGASNKANMGSINMAAPGNQVPWLCRRRSQRYRELYSEPGEGLLAKI